MLQTLTPFIEEAGQIVLDCFARRVPATHKSYLDVVTEADHAASALLSSRLRATFPSHGIVSEEAPPQGPSDLCWYIDPLDGTKNFAHGHPFFCVSAALLRDGLPIVAITHDPVRRETFTAELGGGAFLNGAPIHVSAIEDLSQAMLASGFPSGKRHRALNPQPFHEISRVSQALRRTGSSALDLAYVACGRFDAAWDWGLEPWDVAAGLLLVTESGGLCTNWQGESFLPPHASSTGLLASNSVLHPALLPLLASPSH